MNKKALETDQMALTEDVSPQVSRRSFLRAGFGLATASMIPSLSGCPAFPTVLGPDLPQPNERSSVGGALDVSLTAQFATVAIDGITITTRTYNGMLPGPTLRVRPGDLLRVRLINDLPPNTDGSPQDINIPHHPNTTNLHTHGLHVSPEGNADNVLLEVEPGTQFDYEFEIPSDHSAGTYWYHPHRHGSVATQMFSGMAGALVVEGAVDSVPEIASARDRVLLFQEIRVDADNSVVPMGPHMFTDDFQHTFLGGHRFNTVNGVVSPVIRMAPGEVERWRILNGNVTEYLRLEVEDHDLYLIAWDGLTLANPVALGDLELAPGNRADILVKAGRAGTFRVRSTGGHGHGGMMMKHMGDGGHGSFRTQTLAHMVVEGEPIEMALPGGLPTPGVQSDIRDDELVNNRQLTLSIGPPTSHFPFPRFLIDGQLYDPNRIDHTVALGDVEEWTISNTSMMNHPMHIHTNPFQLMAVNGKVLVDPLWADTVDVPAFGSVTIRMRFLDFAGALPLHCHILTHEDLGMMQLLEITQS